MHSTASTQKKSGGTPRTLLWFFIAMFVLTAAGFIGMRAWFNSFLRGEEFRRLVSRATSDAIQAEGEYDPFHFEGTTIYTDGFHAKNGGLFEELRADRLRAEFNLRGIFNHAWQIDEVEMQRLSVSLESHRQGGVPVEPDENRKPGHAEGKSHLPSSPPTSTRGEKSSGWLPSRLDLRKALIREANLRWLQNGPERGSVEGAALTITPENGAWAMEGEGGRVRQAGWPDLDLQRIKLRYKHPSLFITESEFKQPGSGTLTASGEINFQESVDVQIRLNGLDTEAFLPPDWRARLKGGVFGDVRIRSPLPASAPPRIEGSVRLGGGQLLALPLLDQIALFTRSQQFRMLNLSRASAQFTQAGGRLDVRQFLMESEGLIRIEGNFTVVNGNIDGSFQVGVTPSSLQWLPGSQDKVFTNSHDGYLWTPVRVTGPINNPNDDLRARLAVAAGVTVIEKAGEAVREVPKTIEQTTKGLLDLLFK